MQTSDSLTLARRPLTPPAPTPAPRLRSTDLLRGGHELVIEHQGQEYRLRLTRNDKLILNK
jgi:hemin uptake protein HemP